MKEYEKLLLQEDDRLNNERAKALVKLGLFEQENLTDVDFTSMNEITVGKKYKGVYSLYETHEGELVYIRPLTETDSVKEAYSYDLIKIESVPQEHMATILKAGMQERNGFLKTLYIGQIVLLIISIVVYFATLIYTLIAGSGFAAFVAALINLTSLFSYAFIGIQAGLLMICNIFYKKHLLR